MPFPFPVPPLVAVSVSGAWCRRLPCPFRLPASFSFRIVPPAWPSRRPSRLLTRRRRLALLGRIASDCMKATLTNILFTNCSHGPSKFFVALVVDVDVAENYPPFALTSHHQVHGFRRTSGVIYRRTFAPLAVSNKHLEVAEVRLCEATLLQYLLLVLRDYLHIAPDNYVFT